MKEAGVNFKSHTKHTLNKQIQRLESVRNVSFAVLPHDLDKVLNEFLVQFFPLILQDSD